jgi:two-component system sensor histidine kinase KdpD
MRTLSFNNPRWLAYGSVTLAIIGLVGVCLGIEQAGVHRGYGAFFFLIVVGAALWAGFWPSVYAACVSAVSFDYFFVSPVGVLDFSAPLLFFLVAELIVATAIIYTMQRQATVDLVKTGKFWQ